MGYIVRYIHNYNVKLRTNTCVNLLIIRGHLEWHQIHSMHGDCICNNITPKNILNIWHVFKIHAFLQGCSAIPPGTSEGTEFG